ncbi:MAG TPA: HemK/PrmC family methyltransferase [Actinomycetota bacterium]|nr:HemK/PrmC family methyltransferase [Actinomycetota bacterium]
MSEPRTVARLIDVGERVLDDSTHLFEDHDSRSDAQELLAMCMGVDVDDLDDDDEPSRRVRERFLSLIARRAAGEPFPFLTGYIEFWGLELRVRPGAFVPRPSSELTVARALKRIRRRRAPVVVDLATGAGPIAMAIASELPNADVWGADIQDEGLQLARYNARRLGIRNVHFRRGDLWDALPARLRGTVDLMTGHIPYVPKDELDDLPSEVRDFEPVDTLTDWTKGGLSLIERALNEAPQWLRPGGWVLLELSDDLGTKVRRLARKAGLADHGVAMDDDRLSIVVESRLEDADGAAAGRRRSPRD